MARCPICFSVLGTWSDDPILTKNGSPYSFINEKLAEVPLEDREYKGTTYIHSSHITELQANRTEFESGLFAENNITQFSEVIGHQIKKQHIIELRQSTEKILSELENTKYKYFNYDEYGEYIGTIQTDWINPNLESYKGHIKRIHIEDLRHPFQLLPYVYIGDQQNIEVYKKTDLSFINQVLSSKDRVRSLSLDEDNNWLFALEDYTIYKRNVKDLSVIDVSIVPGLFYRPQDIATDTTTIWITYFDRLKRKNKIGLFNLSTVVPITTVVDTPWSISGVAVDKDYVYFCGIGRKHINEPPKQYALCLFKMSKTTLTVVAERVYFWHGGTPKPGKLAVDDRYIYYSWGIAEVPSPGVIIWKNYLYKCDKNTLAKISEVYLGEMSPSSVACDRSYLYVWTADALQKRNKDDLAVVESISLVRGDSYGGLTVRGEYSFVK